MEQHILERYFKNTCSPEERAKVLEWLSDEQRGEEVKQTLSKLWGNFDDTGWTRAEGAGEPSYAQIRAAIPDLAKQRATKAAKLRVHGWIWRYVAAACIGFALTIGVLLWWDGADTTADGYVTVRTEKGERRHITLNDGSEIYLNADSRITYPVGNEMHQKAIYVEGEAFFNMTESDKPRIIKAGGVETKASTGASKFSIKAFPADSVVTVAMDDGQAEVRTENAALMKLRMLDSVADTAQDTSLPLTKLERPKTMPLIKLKPAVTMNKHEYAVVHKDQGMVDVAGLRDGKKAFGWKDGILYFDEAGADEIATTLARWYGVNVHFCEGERPHVRFSAEFDNKKLADVLTKLGATTSLHYRKDGGEVFLCTK